MTLDALRPEVRETIARLPTSPGVYLMRGEGGTLLYIGKATNLRSRVRSYFSGNDPRLFVRYLDELLIEIDFVLTTNPKEALLLENTLIKKHKPRFNVMLRDDKNYLSIRVDTSHAWPRAEMVRRIRSDGARYFGPYHSAAKARQTLNILNRYFGLRTCNDSMLNNRARPCLQYQIRRCPGPCAVQVDPQAYAENVRDATMFLSGRHDQLVEALQAKMERAAEELAFEEAARYRDQRAAVVESLERQGAVQTAKVDRDVVGLYRQADDLMIVVMFFRDGLLDDVRNWPMSDQHLPDGELLEAFLSQLYADESRTLPREILLPTGLVDDSALADALSELKGAKVALHVPQRGEKLRLIELANENAVAGFEESMSTSAQAEKALERVAKRLGLERPPRTIECYDISNFQGAQIVASQVVFQDAVPDRSRYRRLRIRTRSTQDDFGAIFEVVGRRARRAKKDGDPMPDLLVIDGGKGQLNAAVAALTEQGFRNQAVVGLAKSRITGTDEDDTATRSSERVFLPGRKNPVLLREHTPEYYLLSRIRDEAHDQAINYHRKLRRKATLRSQLDDIPGVGPSRRKALLNHFGSIRSLKEASLADIEQVSGISRALAFAVFDHFHPGEADPPA